MKLIRCFLFLGFIAFLFSYGCQKIKYPIGTNEEPLRSIPIANAGRDQISSVGSYAILDGSKSKPATGERIVWWEWHADPLNPEKQILISGANDSIQGMGYNVPGIYRYVLIVYSGAHVPIDYNELQKCRKSKPDTVMVQVGPRGQSIFEDINLEIEVRAALKIQNGELTENMLLSLDTLERTGEIYFKKIKSLSGIEKCINLKFANFCLENISNIENIASLRQLTYLRLDQNRKIKDISPLRNLVNLNYLNLDSNEIEDISALGNLVNLRYLNLQFNPIRDISVLYKLKNLEDFELANSPIEDISVLSNFRKLKMLWIAGLKINTMKVVENLTDLRLLCVSYNKIGDLKPVSHLLNLERLYADRCGIEDLTPLIHLINLNVLMVNNNKIKDICPLLQNPGIGEGDFIGIKYNPLNEKSIRECIPKLQKRGVIVHYK